MCRICSSNVSCNSGEMVSGATGGEFEINDKDKPGDHLYVKVLKYKTNMQCSVVNKHVKCIFT